MKKISYILIVCLMMLVLPITSVKGIENQGPVIDNKKIMTVANQQMPEAINGVVTLMEDVTLEKYFDVPSDVKEINLNNHIINVEVDYGIRIRPNSSVTIKNGTIKGSHSGIIYLYPKTDTLKDDAIVNIENIKIDANFTSDSSYAIWGNGNGNITLDENTNITVNGKGNQYPINLSKGTLNINGATIINNAAGGYIICSDTVINMTSGTIDGGGKNKYGIVIGTNEADSIVNITGGTIKNCNYAISLDKNASLKMTGGSIEDCVYGIATSGNDRERTGEISISGGSIKGSFLGIYHPSSGTINISGSAYVEGDSGIGLKGGTLNVTGGTIVGIGEYDYNDEPKSNGMRTNGSAIVAEINNTYVGNIKINISNGLIKSVHANAITSRHTFDNNVAKVNITGGSFVASDDQSMFKDIDVSEGSSRENITTNIVVSGGHFSQHVWDYLVDGLTTELYSPKNYAEEPYSYYHSEKEAKKEAIDDNDAVIDIKSDGEDQKITKKEVEVTFDAAGGNFNTSDGDYTYDDQGNIIYSVLVWEDEKKAISELNLPTPIKDGYKFVGWNLKSVGVGSTTVTAIWQKIEQTPTGEISDNDIDNNYAQVKNPNTSDSSNIGLYILTMIISSIGIAFCIKTKKYDM